MRNLVGAISPKNSITTIDSRRDSSRFSVVTILRTAIARSLGRFISLGRKRFPTMPRASQTFAHVRIRLLQPKFNSTWQPNTSSRASSTVIRATFFCRERVRRQINWQEVVQMAQASELPRAHDSAAVAQYMAADSCAKFDRVLESLHGLPVMSLAPLANHLSSVAPSVSSAAPAKFVSSYCAPTTQATPLVPIRYACIQTRSISLCHNSSKSYLTFEMIRFQPRACRHLKARCNRF